VTRTTLVQPTSAELWAEARRLVEEYAASLDVDLSFQGFQHEIESLASEYGPPGGRFVLAEQAGTFIGCGGLRRFSESDCEMKRLYVVPANRRGGVGRTIAEALIEQARHLGYQGMLLDTLPSMIRAQELYSLLGFEPTAAYRYNPAPGASSYGWSFVDSAVQPRLDPTAQVAKRAAGQSWVSCTDRGRGGRRVV
jgi:putative acetyltransferase